MVTPRILERRRLQPQRRHSAPGRRRLNASELAVEAAQLRQRRLGRFGQTYLAAALILTGLVLYLVEAAHVTAASYQIQQLQSQQADLVSQQQQLRYREASLEAPARLDEEATAAGFVRAAPRRYLAYRPVDLAAPNPDAPVVAARSPQTASPWSRWLGLFAGLAPSRPSLGGA